MKNQYTIRSGTPNMFSGVSISGVQLLSMFRQVSCTQTMEDQNLTDDLHLKFPQVTALAGKTGFSDSANDDVDQFFFLAPYILKNI